MNAVLSMPERTRELLAAGPDHLRDWMTRRQGPLAALCIACIIAGAGTFGSVMGSWCDPLQALYTGIKLPLVILLTTLGNGLLNGMLAPLLGLNVSFRQAFIAVLMTFAVAAVVLGALSPVAWFIIWNTPPLTARTSLLSPEYAFLQLTLTVCVAVAGVAGNVRLVPLLRQWTQRATTARNVLLAWLVGNLFLGSQISWVFRPFVWDTHRPVQFFCPDALQGSFFETVFKAIGLVI